MTAVCTKPGSRKPTPVAGAPHISAAPQLYDCAASGAPPSTTTVGPFVLTADDHDTRISVGEPVTASRAARGSFTSAKVTGADSARATGAASGPVASANV